jgi:2-polyprenyl-3-methyl-5-hydroxy-6-metoxy-1,4-benzoquinol methylase
MMTSFVELTISPKRAAEFENQLQQQINQASLTLMISLGYRTGLWEVMSQLDHATCQEIAAQSGLHAGYVSDWLQAMQEGGIVEYDSIFQTYRLPGEHAVILTGSAQYAESLRWLSLLGKVEDELATCFQEGTPESGCASLLADQNSERRVALTNQLFQHLLPLVPGLIMRLCEGLDVLELGCGEGTLLLELASAFPESRFVGHDTSEERIALARQSARARGIENVAFLCREMTEIHAISAFDLILDFDATGKQRDGDQLLREVQTALRPEGTLLMQRLVCGRDATENQRHPLSVLVQSISSLRQLTSDSGSETASKVCRGKETLCRSLEDAGLGSVECHQLPHDVLYEYYIAQQSAVPI